MTDENVVQNGAGEEPQNDKNQTGRAHVGKIGRLPADIREELNLRLYNGKGGPDILPWLNELPRVKEILTARFGGAPINDKNLSNWRDDGYERWLARQDKLGSTKNTAKYASEIAEADCGKIARGAVAIASEKILEFLETPGEKATPENLVKFANASTRLCRSEQNAVRLKIAQERLRQQERHLLLMRDKHQRDTVAILLRYLNDARAKEIEASDCDFAEKIELLGHHMYGDIWEPRQFPPLESAPATPESGEGGSEPPKPIEGY